MIDKKIQLSKKSYGKFSEVKLLTRKNIGGRTFSYLKNGIRRLAKHARKLKGDPHYVAMGMAIGVFVGSTPTIPFHTVLALALAFLLRASKPAAIIGTLFTNPVTIPFIYMASYKLGRQVISNGNSYDFHFDSFLGLAKAGKDVSFAMLTGGTMIGVFSSIIAYIVTKRIFTKIRLRKIRAGINASRKALPMDSSSFLHMDSDDRVKNLISTDIASKQQVSLHRQNEIL